MALAVRTVLSFGPFVTAVGWRAAAAVMFGTSPPGTVEISMFPEPRRTSAHPRPRPSSGPSRLLLVALLLTLGPAWMAAPTRAAPQRHDHGRGIDREIELIVELLDLRPGESVADVGADDGLYSARLGEHVGETGHVYANEITDLQVDEIRDAAVRAGLENVTAIRATDERSGLPAGCCDGIVLRVVYHHLARPEAMLRQFDTALRDGGRLLIIENRPQRGPDAPGVPDNRSGMGIDRDIVFEEITGAGFELIRELDDWPSGRYGGHYALLFSKAS